MLIFLLRDNDVNVRRQHCAKVWIREASAVDWWPSKWKQLQQKPQTSIWGSFSVCKIVKCKNARTISSHKLIYLLQRSERSGARWAFCWFFNISRSLPSSTSVDRVRPCGLGMELKMLFLFKVIFSILHWSCQQLSQNSSHLWLASPEIKQNKEKTTTTDEEWRRRRRIEQDFGDAITIVASTPRWNVFLCVPKYSRLSQAYKANVDCEIFPHTSCAALEGEHLLEYA